ncbi:fimbrial protein [Lelliottia sp. SL45]|nr:fimbrial protein [Lelliottia sp. SL45]MCY1697940.1 fimbrial protein [Lelliottia sp. SL45]
MSNVMLKYKSSVSPAVIILGLLAGVCTALFCGSASAAGSGHCTPSTTGGPKEFSFSYNRTITSPADNKTGETPVVYDWDLGDYYTAQCDTDQLGWSFYFKADAGGAPVGHASQWYILDNNIEYQTVIMVYDGAGNTDNYYTVPFTDVPNNVHHGILMGQDTNFYTGSKGNVKLYIRRPFVGKHIIPPTYLAGVYATTTKGSYASRSVASVTMSGTVTVPQTCIINEGDIINIDFGNIAQNVFNTKGQPPTGFSKKRIDFSIKCSNIANGVDVSLEFNGTPDTTDSTAVKTDNKDIAIRLDDTSNNPISPKGGEIPVNFNYNNQTGTSAMQLYPINSTGNVPKTGIFNSQVTVTVDIQ